jgi:hypothetical protein
MPHKIIAGSDGEEEKSRDATLGQHTDLLISNIYFFRSSQKRERERAKGTL